MMAKGTLQTHTHTTHNTPQHASQCQLFLKMLYFSVLPLFAEDHGIQGTWHCSTSSTV